MSYCRWSSDDWMCDLYCYEDCRGGWTTHVAGNRPIDVPRNNCDMFTDMDGWMKAHQEQMKALDSIGREDIELPYAGETFNDPTLEKFKDRLLMLRELGYKFPDYVLEEVEKEIADGG